MSANITPYPKGHYRLRYAEMTRDELIAAKGRIEIHAPFNLTTGDQVDLIIIGLELDKR